MCVLQDFHKTVVEVTQTDITCSVRENKQRCAVANALTRVFGEKFALIGVGVCFATLSDDENGEYYVWLSKTIRKWIQAYDVSRTLVEPIKMRLQRRLLNNSLKYQYYFVMA